MMPGLCPRKVFWLLAVAFVGSWSLLDCFLFIGTDPGSSHTMWLLLGVGYMLVPGMGALVLERFVWKETFATGLGLSPSFNRWFIAAWLSPAVLAGCACVAGILLPGVSYSSEMRTLMERLENVLPAEAFAEMKRQLDQMPVHPAWLALAQGLFFGPTVNALAALGEELLWRGALFKELAPLGFWKSSLLTGAAWGLWHAPLVVLGLNYPDHPFLGIPMMIAWCMALSPLVAYVRLRSRNVLAAAVMHGTLNATAGLSFMLLEGGSDLTVGITGAAGISVLLLADATIFAIGVPEPGDPSGDHAEDMLEVFDESGRQIGLAPRGSCHGNPSLAHKVVHVIVRNHRGDVFLQRRSRSRKIQPLKWDSSVGGHLRPGESPQEAAIRELAEELGIKVEPTELSVLHEYVWRTDIETELVTTFGLIRDGPFKLDPIEIEEGRFWNVCELREAAGSGVFTPNLEEELRLLRILPGRSSS